MEKKKIFGIGVSIASYQAFIDQVMQLAQNRQSSYTCVANVHMLVEAFRKPLFAKVVKDAEIVTPDGIPLTWSLKLINGVSQPRVAGMDLLPDLLQRCMLEQLPVYFYGGTEEMLAQTSFYLSQNFRSLKIAGTYSPPFRSLTLEEEADIVQKINASGAHLIFVVLGCPKQEMWMAAMKGKINATMIGIGGALPVLIGMQKRAPLWMQQIGLEWFYRLCQEPRRLFKRYAITNTIFIYFLSKEFIKARLFKASEL